MCCKILSSSFLLRVLGKNSSHFTTVSLISSGFHVMARNMGLVCLLLLAGILVARAAVTGNNNDQHGMKHLQQPNMEMDKVSSAESKSDHQVAAAETPAESPSEGKPSEPGEAAESPGAEVGTRKMGKHHIDKSVAGGGVILGGLVTAVFLVVFCYIRVTRRRDEEPLVGNGK